LKENLICGAKYQIWKQADRNTLTTIQKGKELGFVQKDTTSFEEKILFWESCPGSEL